MTGQVPSRRLGTPFQRPSWRYDALRHPDKYGFRSFCSKKVDDAGYLRRLIKKGLAATSNYVVPAAVRTLSSQLPSALAEELFLVWDKHWKRNNKSKVRLAPLDQYDNFVSWNAQKIVSIKDEWFKRLIRHVFNLAHDKDIEAALKLHLNDEYAQIKRYIGHQIFGNVPDADIAKQWQMAPSVITALRMLFFDFSCFPKGKVAQWATLVQWANNGDIKPEEFALYKRVYEMGELGLKAQVCSYALNDDERVAVSDYLSKSAVANTMAIQFATRTGRDALVYNRVINDLTRMNLQREELKVRRAEHALLELQVQKLGRELNNNKAHEQQSEDLVLLQEAISNLAAKDLSPSYPTVVDLDKAK